MWIERTLRFFSLAVLAATAVSNAFAYIDPGTGMSFISGIGAFVAGIFAVAFGAIVMTFRRWKMVVKGMFSKSKDGGSHPV